MKLNVRLLYYCVLPTLVLFQYLPEQDIEMFEETEHVKHLIFIQWTIISYFQEKSDLCHDCFKLVCYKVNVFTWANQSQPCWI